METYQKNRFHHARKLFWLSLVICMLNISCRSPTKTKVDKVENINEIDQAKIIIRVEPNKVPFQRSTQNKWNCWGDLKIIVEEKNGIGATLVEWSMKRFNNKGELQFSVELVLQDELRTFQYCDTHDWYIPSNSKICTEPHVACVGDNEDGWYTEDLMTFVDDNGNRFSEICTINFLPVN